jgi:hypothetical protein
MSAKDNLNGEQLSMFIPVDDLVDKFHKADLPDDLRHEYWKSGREYTPREQWETHSDDLGMPMRDWKMRDVEEFSGQETETKGVVWDIPKGIDEGNIPPVSVGRGGGGQLLNGHHRLAVFEDRQHRRGTQYVPVKWET